MTNVVPPGVLVAPGATVAPAAEHLIYLGRVRPCRAIEYEDPATPHLAKLRIELPPQDQWAPGCKFKFHVPCACRKHTSKFLKQRPGPIAIVVWDMHVCPLLCCLDGRCAKCSLRRWYLAVDLAVAYKRCRARLLCWLERAQIRMHAYGPDGVARRRDQAAFEADFAALLLHPPRRIVRRYVLRDADRCAAALRCSGVRCLGAVHLPLL